MPQPPAPLTVHDLGRLAYAPALAEQRQVNQAVIDGIQPPTLLLVEHDPVITISHRRTAPDHLLASRAQLRELGIAVEETDRGGDITYHGPGQLVAYPILPLAPFGLNLSTYMRLLEQIVIDTLAHFDVRAQREPGATGVWVGEGFRISNFEFRMGQGTSAGTAEPDSEIRNSKFEIRNAAKICAMGVRVRKNTTLHGLALNVHTNLAHFQTIVPCGLTGRAVTSLTELLGDKAPDMDAVKAALTTSFRSALADRPKRDEKSRGG